MDFDLVYKFQMICRWGTYFSRKQLQDEWTDDIQTSVKLNTPHDAEGIKILRHILQIMSINQILKYVINIVII